MRWWANVNTSMLCSASLRNTGLKRMADQVRVLVFATDPINLHLIWAVALIISAAFTLLI
jgi:hypothetical protein